MFRKHPGVVVGIVSLEYHALDACIDELPHAPPARLASRVERPAIEADAMLGGLADRVGFGVLTAAPVRIMAAGNALQAAQADRWMRCGGGDAIESAGQLAVTFDHYGAHPAPAGTGAHFSGQMGGGHPVV